MGGGRVLPMLPPFIFYRNIINYFKIFVEQSKDFGFADWLMAVFVILINLTFIILIFIKLFQLLKNKKCLFI